MVRGKRSILVAVLCFVFILMIGCSQKQKDPLTDSSSLAEKEESTGFLSDTEQTEQVDQSEKMVQTEQPVTGTKEVQYRQIVEYVEPESLSDSQYDLETALTCIPLKEAFEPYFKFGMAMTGYNSDTLAVNSEEMKELLKYHVNTTTMTNMMKPSNMLDQITCMENASKGVEDPAINFETTDQVLAFCKENGIGLRGHTLVWHNQTPDWFFREGYTEDGSYVDEDKMKYRLESYIKQMIEHCQNNYPGVVYCWDVVNEAIEIGDGESETGWYCRKSGHSPTSTNQYYDILGYEYVELAFTYARKYADSDVVLVYNDYNTQDSAKQIAICNLIRYLKEKNLVDALGMQSNLSTDTDLSKVFYSITEYAKLGVELQVTELNIIAEDTSEASYEEQAKDYETFMKYIMVQDEDNGGPANITVVNVFSLMDGYLFYDDDQTNYCLFDRNIQPKPCYYAIIDTVAKYGKNNTYEFY